MRELDLLEYVYATTSGADVVVVGPGDDMAMLRLPGTDLLAAVDQVVADRHFRADGTPPEAIGRKAVTRCLSDVAAMAGEPVAALAAATLPPDYGTSRARSLFDGIRVTAEAYGCPLVGGDIAFHAGPDHPLTCAVTVLARPGDGGPVLRRGAQPGDEVYVTGRLGGTMDAATGGGSHLDFSPRLAEARELREVLGPKLHAMIDVSDGLGRDATNIAARSGVRIEIDATSVPCADGVPWRRAAGEGEDYELLFAATGPVPSTLGDGLPVTRIGRVLPEGAEPTRVVFRDGDQLVVGDELGWQHES